MDAYDLAVLGAGPGGYVAAIRAAQAGRRVALIEAENLGGICLNWGCIPTKALLHCAESLVEIRRSEALGVFRCEPIADLESIVRHSRHVADTNRQGVEYLMKKNKITVLRGQGQLLSQRQPFQLTVTDSEGQVQHCSAAQVILATGARARPFPGKSEEAPGILSYRQAMNLKDLPESLAVIGSGAIGIELSWFFRQLGVPVTIIEAADRLLPAEDPDISRALQMSYQKQGIECLPGASIESWQAQGTGHHLVVLDAKQTPHELKVSHVLVAIGMQPNTENLGLEALGVTLDAKGFIQVDEGQQTTCPGIYAIGDCCGRQLLAHKASAEAEVAVAHLLGQQPAAIAYDHIPACIYSHPQIASVGLHDRAAKAQGRQVDVGRYPLQANGKARAISQTEGWIKIVVDRNTDQILGAQILGYDAPELIASMTLALQKGLTRADLEHWILPHPTLSESLHEALLASSRRAIHL